MASIACIALLAPLAGVVAAEEQDPTLAAIAEAIQQVKSRYVGAVDEQKLVADALRGMLQGLDPYSDYLDPAAYRELKQDNGGRFTGLGMEVSMDAGAVRVLAAYEDSPAYQAGLRPGDLITRMNGESVEGLTLDQAIQRARGEPSTSIGLTVLHAGSLVPEVVTVKRAIVQSRSVKSALIGAGYGYARITHFDQRTPELLLTALAKMSRESDGGLRGILLDLRDNPGGVLKSAVGVASIFLPDESLVVSTEAASAESRMRLVTGEKHYLPVGSAQFHRELSYFKGVPLVVLVNSGSASASEVVAGALQDQRRATIAGTQTFGKASVQVLVPLTDGSALKLTTAHYLTPAGQRIQGRGVTPDRIVERAKAVDGPNANAAEFRTKTVGAVPACAVQVPRLPGVDAADCQLAAALELLRHLPVMAKN